MKSLYRQLRHLLHPFRVWYELFLGKYFPKKLASIRYKDCYGVSINWKSPKTIDEKIQWLKYNTDTTHWTLLADKYRVRKYVADCGLGDILVPLYGKWDKPKDIDWKSLPQQFVMKTNNASKTVLICKDKDNLDIDWWTKEIDRWMHSDYSIEKGETHYRAIPPCIIAEQLLDVTKQSVPSSSLIDYKVWAFNGKPWCIYHAAEILGRKDIAAAFLHRALSYRNTFDPASGFASPRYKDGSFKKDLDPYQTYGEGFIEGNSWNFSFHVPHDPSRLMDCMGGEEVFRQRLDELFEMDLPEKYYADNEDITADCLVGGYVHGNEPSHHVPYLYAWTAQPWKAQDRIRTILNKMYRNDIRGLGGNDDCGQMSAWYVFSVMGFYPVAPGCDQYVLGAPYLPYLKVKLENGNTLEIKAPGVSDRKRYVRSVRLNGKLLTRLYLTHEELMKGGTLEFEMSERPNRKRGLSAEDKPYSLTQNL